MDFDDISIGLLEKHGELPAEETILNRFRDGLYARLNEEQAPYATGTEVEDTEALTGSEESAVEEALDSSDLTGDESENEHSGSEQEAVLEEAESEDGEDEEEEPMAADGDETELEGEFGEGESQQEMLFDEDGEEDSHEDVAEQGSEMESVEDVLVEEPEGD